MIRTALITAAMLTAVTTPAAGVERYTAYTPDGAAVIMESVDPTTHDDDRVVTMEEGAELYISFERLNGAYTLYTISPAGVEELWMYGYGSADWADDIAADWQVWPYPSIRLLEGYGD